MSNRTKGDRGERELSNWLEDEANYYAQRTAASGRATGRPRPDVIASKAMQMNNATLSATRARVLLIELKAWSEATGSFDGEKIGELKDIAERAGGEAWVAIKPDLRSFDQWHCFRVGDLNETEGGNYSVRKQDLPGKTRSEAFQTKRFSVELHSGP